MSQVVAFRMDDPDYERLVKALARTGVSRAKFILDAVDTKVDNVLSVKTLSSHDD